MVTVRRRGGRPGAGSDRTANTSARRCLSKRMGNTSPPPTRWAVAAASPRVTAATGRPAKALRVTTAPAACGTGASEALGAGNAWGMSAPWEDGLERSRPARWRRAVIREKPSVVVALVAVPVVLIVGHGGLDHLAR